MAAVVATPLFMRDALLTLKIGAAAASEYQCHVTEARLQVTAGDTVTVRTLCSDGVFSSPGQPSYALILEALQDWSADGLARYLWTHEGEVAAFVLQAHGETVAIGAETPAMTGNVTLAAGDYGGVIDEYATMSLELPCTAKPVLDTTP